MPKVMEIVSLIFGILAPSGQILLVLGYFRQGWGTVILLLSDV